MASRPVTELVTRQFQQCRLLRIIKIAAGLKLANLWSKRTTNLRTQVDGSKFNTIRGAAVGGLDLTERVFRR